MGDDIQTYRARIGTYRHYRCYDGIDRCMHFRGIDLVTFVSNILKPVGRVLFIGVLLMIAGVELNPGPREKDQRANADDNDDKVNVLCTHQTMFKKSDTRCNHRWSADTFVLESNWNRQEEVIEKEHEWTDWAKCAQEKDVNSANTLLNSDILPNQENLQLAFDNFINVREGKELLKDIVQRIENRLMETNEKIENVKGCFKHEDPGKKITFVIQTLEPTTIDCQYENYVIKQHITKANDETEIENLTGYQFTEKFFEANECLRIKSPGLMESHSNLTGTSLGTVKLRTSQDPENTICIILYVEAKGYIPVGEDPLPSQLEYDKDTVFKTDVRECKCAIATAGPSDKHEDLKSGCRIESTKVPDGGTLGGFINHPDHGMCFMTCSHVLLSVEEFEKHYNRQMDSKTLHETQCFQPQQPDICGKVCDVRFFKGNENNGGMDIAFVKVDESRKPKTTSFPDIFGDDSDEDRKIPPIIDHLLLQALQYDPRSVIQNSMQMKEQMKVNNQVVKYGCKSKLTSGIVQCLSSSQRFQMYGHFFTDGRNARQKSKKLKYILNDQIQILDDCGCFSDKGDSGSMVFVTNEHKELMALGILTGRVDETKTTFVTPIWNILKEIQMPRPYTLAEPRSTQMVIEELKRTAFLITGKCEALVKILEH